MRRFILKISYDGSNYKGWQSQLHRQTVQDVLEAKLAQVFKQPTTLFAAGRTDTGVHAIGQIAHFSTTTRMTTEQIIKALNRLLPKSIYICNCWETTDLDFHARFSAIERQYEYKISKKFSPCTRLYTAYFPRYSINIDRLNSYSGSLLGTHNFRVFANDTTKLVHCDCIIYTIEWAEDQYHYYFRIQANRFLHNMVRRIVGTLLYMDYHHYKNTYLQVLLKTQNFDLLGPTAPPNGLYLVAVHYDKKFDDLFQIQ